MYKFYLCGVEVRRTFRPGKSVRDAIVALDLKITEFQEKYSTRRYRTSNEMSIECAEILGEIKFMYLAGYLKRLDYQRVVNALTGQQFDNVEEDNYYE